MDLAILNACFDICVRRIDEPVERQGVCGRSRSQLHMTHLLAGTLQQASRIGQVCAVKEPYVDVRSEYINVTEGRISQTGNRTAIMQKFPDFIAAFSHRLKPLMCDGPQFACMFFHPRVNGGIALNRTVESQKFCFHYNSTSCF